MKKKNLIGLAVLFYLSVVSFRTVSADNPAQLAAEWTMDEGAGNIIYDTSGNINNGAIYGAVRTQGICGKGLYFDGVDDYVRVEDSDKLDVTNAITIECWVKPARDYMEEAPQWFGYVVLKHLSYRLGWQGWIDGWTFGIYHSGGVNEYLSITDEYIYKDTWYHIVGVYDGTYMQLYINGQLKAEKNIGPVNIDVTTTALYMGRQFGTYFNGTLDWLKIYSRSLSFEEIKEHYRFSTLRYFDNFDSYSERDLINGKPNWESSDIYYSKGWTVYQAGEGRRVINFAPSPWPGGFPLNSNYATYHAYSPKKIINLQLTLDYSIMPNSDMRAYISGDNQTWVDVTGVIGMRPSPIEDDWKNAKVDLSSYIAQANIINDVYIKFIGAAYSGSGWGVKIDTIIVDLLCNSPPSVDAGPNMTIDSADIPYTKINGTPTDPDGDPLTYRWVIDAQGTEPVGPQGEAILDLANLLQEGSHEAVLEVTDGHFTVRDSMILTVNNSPPIAVPKISGTYKIGEDIILRADVADFDGDTLDYKWYEGDVVYNSGSIDAYLGGQPVALPNVSIDGGLALGDHIITLEVNDRHNPVIIKRAEVKVTDTQSPTLTPTAEPTILWPPNHQMVPVEIYANAKDNSGGPVTLSATVTSSEPPETDKNGNIIPDYTDPQIDQLTGKITLQLRAERQGKGTGRTYTITITATDESNNSSQAKVEVVAPHDRGDKK